MNSRIIYNEQEEAQYAFSINRNDILGSVKGSAKRPGIRHGFVKEPDEIELIRACSISIEQDDLPSQYCIGDYGFFYFDNSGPAFYFDNAGLLLLETDSYEVNPIPSLDKIGIFFPTNGCVSTRCNIL